MISIRKEDRITNATVNLPSSKSITNRALIIQAVSSGKVSVINCSDSTDSALLKNCLNLSHGEINVGDAGTAFRFLTTYLANKPGEYLLTGSKRLCSRPISSLVNSLRQTGGEIEYQEIEGFAPLKITGKKLNGGKISVDAEESSQFISSLLLSAPLFQNGVEIMLQNNIVSESYIKMTIELMKDCGINVSYIEKYIAVVPQQYQSCEINVENDWSAASFWYEIAALSQEAEIIFNGLNETSIQGDSIVRKLFEVFGVRTNFVNSRIVISKEPDFKLPSFFNYDFTNCPDLVMPVAAFCAAKGIAARFEGVKNLRLKESDRIDAMKTEFIKIGCLLEDESNSFSLKRISLPISEIIFDSHNDHRIAMSLAPLAVDLGTIRLNDHQVVSKSYPFFWNDLSGAGYSLTSI